MRRKITASKKRAKGAGRKSGPKTIVTRLRYWEDDYKCLRSCWTYNNPKEFQTFSEWQRDKLHDLAEGCRALALRKREQEDK